MIPLARPRRSPLRRLGRALLWLAGGVVVSVLGLLAPSAYVATMCRGTPVADAYAPILPPEHRRAEARTLLTYPEWHIVYAYEDYAETIRTGAPHDYGYLGSIGQFWGSFCSLQRETAAHGGATWENTRTIHVIGVSFTAEMLLKAAYEETLGRLAYGLFGRGHLDDVSARQAADYGAFLHQVPWYRWDFPRDAAELAAESTGSARDRERLVALGFEYGAKARYARVIAAAVASVGFDQLTMRSVVSGVAIPDLERIEGVMVISQLAQGVEIETPRYAAFTGIARAIGAAGGAFVEIAGNDDILVTTLSDGAQDGVVHQFPRQGSGSWRQLRLVKVGDLAALLADPTAGVEHVYDY